MQYLKQSTAKTLRFGPFLDDTDGKTAETGLTISQADIRLSKNGGAFAQSNDSSGATHDENGWYYLQLDTTDTNTLGPLTVAIHESGALPVWREFMIVTSNWYDTMFSTDQLDVNVTNIEGSDPTDQINAACDTALADYDGPTNAEMEARTLAAASYFDPAADTVANVTTVGTLTGHTAQTGDNYARLGAPAGASVSADIAAVKAETADIVADTNELQGDDVPGLIAALNDVSTAEVNAEVDTALAEIHLDHLLAATYDPASKPGAADALLNELVESDGGVSRFTANALEEAPTGGSAPTAGEIADAVWDEAAGDHVGAGTFGQQCGTDIDAILTDTAEIGAAGAGLTGVPWNSDWDAEVQSEVQDAIEVNKLDHLVAVADADDPVNDSILAKLAASDGDWSGFDNSTDSLEAVRDNQAGADTGAIADAVWDEARSGHTTAGTFGETLGTVESNIDNLDAAISGLNDLSAAEVNAQVDTALSDINLDHLLAVADADDVVNDSVIAKLAASDGDWSGFDKGTDALEAIRDNQAGADASAIADAVWDEAKSGHTAAGSFGEEVQAHSLSTEISALNDPTAAAIRAEIDANSTQLAAIVADTDELQTDDVPALIAALNDPTAAAIADAVWDELLTGATHNIATSAGRLLREIADTEVLVGETTAQTGGAQTITLAAGASAIDDFYNQTILIIVSGTGAGQARTISDYDGTTKIATVCMAWGTEPDNTSVYVIRGMACVGVHAMQSGVYDLINAEADTALADYDGPTKAELDSGFSALNDPTAGAIADAVWDETSAGHTDAGKAGQQLWTDLDAVLADTNEIQGDLVNGGRLDLLIDAILADTAELQTDWADGGRLDLLIDELTSQGDTNEGKLDTIDTVVDAILVDSAALADTAISEITGAADIPATPTLRQAVMLVYMWLRNNTQSTATERRIFNDAGTEILDGTMSDDGTTFAQGKLGDA